MRASIPPLGEGLRPRRLLAGAMVFPFLVLALLGNPATAAAAEPNSKSAAKSARAVTAKQKAKSAHAVTAKQKAKPAKKIVAGKKPGSEKAATTKAALKAKARAAKTLATRRKSPVRAHGAQATKPRATRRAPMRPLAPKPILQADTGVLGATRKDSPKPVLEPRSPALPWAAVTTAVMLVSGAFLWRRQRQIRTRSKQGEFIDPVLNLDPGDVAASRAQVKADLLQRAEPFFVDLRMASSHKDHDFILQHCTEDLATSLILDSETEAMAPQVEGLKAELVDLFEEANRYVASVQYTAHVQQGDTPPRKVQELWHFVHELNTEAWRLAAVEPA